MRPLCGKRGWVPSVLGRRQQSRGALFSLRPRALRGIPGNRTCPEQGVQSPFYRLGREASRRLSTKNPRCHEGGGQGRGGNTPQVELELCARTPVGRAGPRALHTVPNLPVQGTLVTASQGEGLQGTGCELQPWGGVGQSRGVEGGLTDEHVGGGGMGPRGELRIGISVRKWACPKLDNSIIVNPQNSNADKGRKGSIQDPMDYKLSFFKVYLF